MFCPQPVVVVVVAARHLRVGHTVFFCSDSRALIEQNRALLELRVRVFSLRVSVLQVHDPLRANISPLPRCVKPTETFCRFESTISCRMMRNFCFFMNMKIQYGHLCLGSDQVAMFSVWSHVCRSNISP